MDQVQRLLSGPRGRRMLLEYAMESEQRTGGGAGPWPLNSAVFDAARGLDPAPGLRYLTADHGLRSAEPVPPSAGAVARLLDATAVAEPSPELLRTALVRAVDSACYWQQQDGTDLLTAVPEVSNALGRVAAFVSAQPRVAWWSSPVESANQWALTWHHDGEPASASEITSTGELLRRWRESIRQKELHAARDRPTDPAANWSGEWWSTPGSGVVSSSRVLEDGSPAGLWFVEDSLGLGGATARSVVVPDGARVYEIDGAEAWAALCARYPVEVTAEKRHDWYRATGRVGRWLVPDWEQVALRHDGVHLTVAGYLQAAGTVIDVGDGGASVIAGWNPDETYWLTDEVVSGDVAVEWVLGDEGRWTRERGGPR